MQDVVIAVAITDANAKSKAHGISLFVVEEGMPGFKKGRNLDKKNDNGKYFTCVLCLHTIILGTNFKLL